MTNTMTRPGINHIELWVSSLTKSLPFYSALFQAIGWHPLGEKAFSTGSAEIYLVEKVVGRQDSLGVRHICFQAVSRQMVDDAAAVVNKFELSIVRGPI